MTLGWNQVYNDNPPTPVGRQTAALCEALRFAVAGIQRSGRVGRSASGAGGSSPPPLPGRLFLAVGSACPLLPPPTRQLLLAVASLYQRLVLDPSFPTPAIHPHIQWVSFFKVGVEVDMMLTSTNDTGKLEICCTDGLLSGRQNNSPFSVPSARTLASGFQSLGQV